jgi:hypothetical protein
MAQEGPALTKNLAIIEDGVVVDMIAIDQGWTEEEWAPFVPEGKTAVLSETAHITDRYIDGKFMRQFKMPREDGWSQLVFGDVDNPPEEVVPLVTHPWKLSPTYQPSASEQIESLKAQIELMETDLKGRVEQLETEIKK